MPGHRLFAMLLSVTAVLTAGRAQQTVPVKLTAAVGAEPVYELLGKRGLGTDTFPATGTALMAGDIAFRQHDMGHTPGPNWRYFLDFAARYFADD